MDIKSAIGGMGHVVSSVAKGAARGLGKLQAPAPDQAQMIQQFSDQAAQQMNDQTALPQPQEKPFELPGLDDSLNEQGQANKAAWEADNPGVAYNPTDDDYTDAGEYGYRHKKTIHDALQNLERDMEESSKANKIDYAGIMKSRLADLGNAPKEHKANPLLAFAIGLGGGDKAADLIRAYTEKVDEGNESDKSKWMELLQVKQDAIKGAMQQAMQQGDMRTIIQKKWADQLMEIEKSKEQLAGQVKVAKEKGDASVRAADVRGRWAADAVKSRAAAMLAAAGIRAGSAEFRTAVDNATKRVQNRIAKGQSAEQAYEDVMDELHDEYDDRVSPGAAPTGAPAPGGAAPAAKPALNPLEEAAAKRRAGKK